MFFSNSLPSSDQDVLHRAGWLDRSADARRNGKWPEIHVVKTAIYLRQSLDRDRNQLAINRQREDLLKLCATTTGWDDPLEYCDDDISAKNGSQRPAWDELCGDIRDGVIGRLAVWDERPITPHRARRRRLHRPGR